jgi:EmrB/QacA subfamily drug resistance transporter
MTKVIGSDWRLRDERWAGTVGSMEKTTRNIILAVATLGGVVATFAASAITVAIPRIEQEFELSAVVLSWIPLTYVLAAAALIMTAGRLGDIFGRVKVFTIGLVGFNIFMFAAALAPSGAWLITLRTLQGLSAALLFATNIALVTLSQPPEARGRALGMLTAGVYLGSSTGPVLGGLMTDYLGWRSMFLFVGGATLVTCALTIWKLHNVEWKEPRKARFDILGSVIWAIALPSLLLGFTLLPETIGITLVGIGAIGLAFFLWWETHAADPLLSVNLLRHNRTFALSNVAALINYSATFGLSFLMTLYLHYNRGFKVSEVGYVLVAAPVFQTIVSPFAGRLADRLQPRLVGATGQALCALGLFTFAFLGTTTPLWFIVLALCVLGVGFGLFASPVAHMVMSSVDRQYVGTASATLATMRVAGQGVSMGIAGLLLAIMVGGSKQLHPSDYPNLLASVRVTFAIFAVLCALGLVAVLLGRQPQVSKVTKQPQ